MGDKIVLIPRAVREFIEKSAAGICTGLADLPFSTSDLIRAGEQAVHRAQDSYNKDFGVSINIFRRKYIQDHLKGFVDGWGYVKRTSISSGWSREGISEDQLKTVSLSFFETACRDYKPVVKNTGASGRLKWYLPPVFDLIPAGPDPSFEQLGNLAFKNATAHAQVEAPDDFCSYLGMVLWQILRAFSYLFKDWRVSSGKLIGGRPLGDKDSAAALGFFEAVRTFDARRGTPLTEFARSRMKGAAMEAGGDAATIRMSRHAYRNVKTVENAQEAFFMIHGRKPDDQELAGASGLDATRLQAIRAKGKVRVVPALDSLDDMDDVLGPKGEVLCSLDPDPETALSDFQVRRIVSECLDAVPVKERTAMVLHLCEGLTLEEIAESFSVKAQNVHYWIHNSTASQKLKKCLKTRLGESLSPSIA
jgi:RNA polymerase sigma factor (sigma-70 family)